jgi:peptidoglycan/xylan/chitin deacetylase (PgdA/CDA1 family)
MRVISPLLKHFVYPGLSRSGYLRRSARDGPTVITYHGILPEGYQFCDEALDGHLVTAETFQRQVRLLQAKYNLISPDQFALWCEGRVELPPRAILLTCDDGLLNTLTDMLPIIRKFDLPFLFFVTGASVLDRSSTLWYEQLYLWLLRGGSNLALRVPWRPEPFLARGRAQTRLLWRELITRLSRFDAGSRNQYLKDLRTQIGISENWESEYSHNGPLRRRFCMLNARELRTLVKAGVTIGAHTISHPMLSQMPADLAFDEIAQSRFQLEELLGTEVWAFAFPFGNSEAVSAREPGFARRAGLKCAFMNVENGNLADRFSFPRVHVSAGMNLSEFEAHVSGFYNSIRHKTIQVCPGVSA